MNRKTTHRRLLTLAAFLRELPTRKWDYDSYSAPSRVEVSSEKPPKLDPHHCKTVACAAGWATVIPSFRRAGLTLGPWGVPEVGDAMGADAMAEVLGIEKWTAEKIFTVPSFYGKNEGAEVTKTMVARALEKLAKEYE